MKTCFVLLSLFSLTSAFFVLPFGRHGKLISDKRFSIRRDLYRNLHHNSRTIRYLNLNSSNNDKIMYFSRPMDALRTSLNGATAVLPMPQKLPLEAPPLPNPSQVVVKPDEIQDLISRPFERIGYFH